MTSRFSPERPVTSDPVSDLAKMRGIQLARATIGLMSLIALVHLGIRFTISSDWRLFLLAGIFALGAILAFISLQIVKKGSNQTGAILLLALTQICLIIASILVAGVGFFTAISIILLTIIVSTTTLGLKLSNRALISGLIAAFIAVCVNIVQTPFLQVSRLQVFPLQVFYALILVVLTITVLVLIIYRFIPFTIRLKLLITFLVLTLLPLAGISLLATRYTNSMLSDMANQGLTNSAKQTAAQLDAFFRRNQYSLASYSGDKDFVSYLSLPISERVGNSAEDQALVALKKLKDTTANTISFSLLNNSGTILISTDQSEGGQDQSRRDFVKAVQSGHQDVISTVEFEGNTNQASFYIITPIMDANNQFLGALNARFDVISFYLILVQNENAVQNGSYPIVFDENLTRLGDPMTPQDLYKTAIPLSSDQITKLQANYRLPNQPVKELSNNLTGLARLVSSAQGQFNFAADIFNNNTMMLGAVSPLATQNWKVVYIQAQSLILAPAEYQNRMAILFVALIALITSVIDLGIANLLSQPIRSLTTTAQRIANGDLLAQAHINTQDEIESLAVAFNLMTSQLRSSIESLEVRVQERTLELAKQTQKINFRVIQLQTVSDVARAIASVQNFEQLLTTVTNLTSERFNFYHVGIFLLDNAKEFAVLRAANSEGGQRMLARHHRLRVGQTGIVGYVAGSGKARIATDVGEDAVFFSNPDLPLTRSEMALPLTRGDEVIGFLDVQSVTGNEFTEDDIKLFSTLADQIAIVIVNNRLYDETRQALAEAQATHRRYLRQEWDKVVFERDARGYQIVEREIQQVSDQSVPAIEEAIEKGEVCISQPDTSSNGRKAPGTSTLAVPIKLRGEVVGVIGLQETDSDRQWYPEEISMVESVAEQVALALENARLFEQTVRRADRERKALDITNKIRASSDPQTMLKTAVTELQQALRASRAQVLLQPLLTMPEESEDNPSGDGKNNGSGNSSAA